MLPIVGQIIGLSQSLSTKPPSKELTTETIKLNKSAENQPSTVKPFTRLAVHFTIRMFMTSRNNPSVTIVTGMVRMISIGFTNVFSKANTNATIIVVLISMISTPGKIQAAINAATAVRSTLIINPIALILNKCTYSVCFNATDSPCKTLLTQPPVHKSFRAPGICWPTPATLWRKQF